MLKTLSAHIKEFKAASIVTPIFMLLEVIMETIIPFMMASIIDNGVNKGDIRHIYVMGGLMVISAAFSLFCGYMGGKYAAKASTGFAKNLRRAMYENIQTFSFSNIDKFSTAGLVTRLTTDVTNIQNAYQMLLRMCMRSPASLICSMVMAFFVNAKIAMIYLIAVLVLGVVLAFLMGRTVKFFNSIFQKYDDLNASVQENVSAIRVVKAYVREDYEKEKFKEASGNVCRLFSKAESMMVMNMPIMQLTIYTCILGISWMGAHMIVSSSLTTGDLSLLLAYCMSILMNLMMLSMIFVMMTMSVASGKRIAEVLNEKPDIVNPTEPVMEVKDGSIVFHHVNFSYNKENSEPVLKDINISIQSGETIGILGGTGSGKSSFANLISRLYDVDEGKEDVTSVQKNNVTEEEGTAKKGAVLVGGINVKAYDLDVLRNQVSVVLQNNVLFSGSILDNLRWGNPEATQEECIRACKLACADEFIEKMAEGYNTHIEQGGTNVSGGQKQRLCIARALLKKPKILILDDSTSAVDTATDAKIRQAFAEEIPGTTKLIIAQRISSIQHADRIIVMEDGRIDGIGTHEELLENNEIYKDVFESQTSGSGDFDEAS